ncbi:MAG TPA: hypothetical protein DEV98_05655 [Clostridiales bacterium]|nr:hypothetical protein [Clostridiales bacterium]
MGSAKKRQKPGKDCLVELLKRAVAEDCDGSFLFRFCTETKKKNLLERTLLQKSGRFDIMKKLSWMGLLYGSG